MSSTSAPDAPPRRTLRDLSLPARLVLSAFLISVGIGYFSALVQLHFQQAPAGKPLPEGDDVERNYHGQPPTSVLERIVTTPEQMPFTASGSMRSAFTTRSIGWNKDIQKQAKETYGRPQFARDKYAREKYARQKNAKFDDLSDDEKTKLLAAFDELPEAERKNRLSAYDELREEQKTRLLAAFDESSEDDRKKVLDTFANLPPAEQEKLNREAEATVRKAREGEADAVVHWMRNGFDKKTYEADAYPLPDELKGKPIARKFLGKDESERDTIRIKKIFEDRCARCHYDAFPGPPADAPLDSYDGIMAYAKPDNHGSGMGLKKLAQSTHVHLLGFSMLYGFTGLIFAFTSYPSVLRFFLAPAALLAQVVDISFWWLARLPAPHGPQFARAIIISGGVVAGSLALQIVLSLLNMFGWLGRMILVLAMAAALAGGYFAHDKYVKTYLEVEKSAPARVN
jgi:hypothetical protein